MAIFILVKQKTGNLQKFPNYTVGNVIETAEFTRQTSEQDDKFSGIVE